MFDNVTVNEVVIFVVALAGFVGAVAKLLSPIFSLKKKIDDMEDKLTNLSDDVKGIQDSINELEVASVTSRLDAHENKLSKNDEQNSLMLLSIYALLSNDNHRIDEAKKKLEDFLISRK